jgi:hypothetical protein
MTKFTTTSIIRNYHNLQNIIIGKYQYLTLLIKINGIKIDFLKNSCVLTKIYFRLNNGDIIKGNVW